MNSILKIIIPIALLAMSCAAKTEVAQVETQEPTYPEKAKDMVIYEVNIRQYTPEGTINAFANHLLRLEQLGVDILWVMPVQPIGEKNRKGGLGSYYSISDYTAVNPEFGTMDDFKNLVAKAHELGMIVIL
ncbi:MAG: alpha-amylase, partial [Ekhidna sp.]|nr:alpha-amylase [Ekhidna sp.]